MGFNQYRRFFHLSFELLTERVYYLLYSVNLGYAMPCSSLATLTDFSTVIGAQQGILGVRGWDVSVAQAASMNLLVVNRCPYPCVQTQYLISQNRTAIISHLILCYFSSSRSLSCTFTSSDQLRICGYIGAIFNHDILW